MARMKKLAADLRSFNPGFEPGDACLGQLGEAQAAAQVAREAEWAEHEEYGHLSRRELETFDVGPMHNNYDRLNCYKDPQWVLSTRCTSADVVRSGLHSHGSRGYQTS
jgi:hypothetical protein